MKDQNCIFSYDMGNTGNNPKKKTTAWYLTAKLTRTKRWDVYCLSESVIHIQRLLKVEKTPADQSELLSRGRARRDVK